jgi:hypothetical protein
MKTSAGAASALKAKKKQKLIKASIDAIFGYQ